MYKYEYISVDYNNGFAKNELIEHRRIIDNMSNKGWKFICAIPTMNKGYGIISRVDLVFEKQKEI